MVAEVHDALHSLGADPRLGRRAAPRRVNDADGDAQMLPQLAGIEVGQGREIRHRRGRALLPSVKVRLRFVGWRERRVALYLIEANFGVVGRGGLLLAVQHVAPAEDGHLHVALARAEPHLAAEHVRELQLAVAVGKGHCVRSARLGRSQGNAPAPLRVRHSRQRSFRPPCADGDRTARRGMSREFKRRLLLKHHVTAVCRRQHHSCIQTDRT